MTAKGIRILDKKNRIVNVELSDILNEIYNGKELHWSIAHLYASGNLGEGNSIPIFIKKVNESENGYYICWDDLNLLAHKLYEIIDILILGCKNEANLIRYKNDFDMYETCEVVIEMVDSCFWEVFSINEDLITRLAVKFKETELLESNYEK